MLGLVTLQFISTVVATQISEWRQQYGGTFCLEAGNDMRTKASRPSAVQCLGYVRGALTDGTMKTLKGEGNMSQAETRRYIRRGAPVSIQGYSRIAKLLPPHASSSATPEDSLPDATESQDGVQAVSDVSDSTESLKPASRTHKIGVSPHSNMPGADWHNKRQKQHQVRFDCFYDGSVSKGITS